MSDSASESKQLTLDEYIKFIQLHLPLVDLTRIRQQKEREAVDVRFELKD